jgi:hypothetical protein
MRQFVILTAEAFAYYNYGKIVLRVEHEQWVP